MSAMLRGPLHWRNPMGIDITTLWQFVKVRYWKWPIEIVDLPIKDGEFHSYVSLPEGTCSWFRRFIRDRAFLLINLGSAMISMISKLNGVQSSILGAAVVQCPVVHVSTMWFFWTNDPATYKLRCQLNSLILVISCNEEVQSHKTTLLSSFTTWHVVNVWSTLAIFKEQTLSSFKLRSQVGTPKSWFRHSQTSQTRYPLAFLFISVHFPHFFVIEKDIANLDHWDHWHVDPLHPT